MQDERHRAVLQILDLALADVTHQLSLLRLHAQISDQDLKNMQEFQ